ncbi:MAG: arylsulfatase [Planctomycetota bacterium]|jgi:arylsulfatase A-like enzyme
MNRRRIIQTVTALLVLATTSPAVAEEEERAPARPNIIFIMADDLGYGDLGCYGQKRIQTPNIDRFAAEGMRFTQCYAGASVCAPSRCSLMTGLHTGHTTVRGNKGQNAPRHDGEANRIPLHADDTTVATLLKRAGYATGITGKWGLGEPGSSGLPNDHGFDEWFGYLNQGHAHDYYTDYLWRNRQRQVIAGNLESRRTAYSADLFSDVALEFIRREKDRPFFLYVATTIPHKNYEVPELAPYADETWPDEAKAYAAMVTRMDSHVGKMLTLLRELDLDRKTIVFFTSDNGAAREWKGIFDSCGPLRDTKFSLYEGGLRVPMIVRWPGNVPPGSVNDTAWYFADFLPTAVRLTNSTVPAAIDGIDVTATLLDHKKKLPDRFMYWELPEGDSKALRQAVRWKQWKAVRHDPRADLELYHLPSDIGEANDVSADHPEVTSEILNFLKTARTPSPFWPAAID